MNFTRQLKFVLIAFFLLIANSVFSNNSFEKLLLPDENHFLGDFSADRDSLLVRFLDFNKDFFARHIYKLILKKNGAQAPTISSPELHPGWPVEYGTFEYPASLGDLDNDDLKDIVFSSGSSSYTVVAIGHDGNQLPGWPKFFTNPPENPAVEDVSGDGQPDVVVSERYDYLHAYSGDGTELAGWPVNLRQGANEQFMGSPIVDDLDGDGNNEIIIHSSDLTDDLSYIFVFDGQGNLKTNWPQVLPIRGNNDYWINILVGNMTGDGQKELAVTQSKGSNEDALTACLIYDLNGEVLPGWPVYIEGEKHASRDAALSDLTGDGLADFIFSTRRLVEDSANYTYKTIHAFEPNGSYVPGWPVSADFLIPDFVGDLSMITLGDLDNDQIPEVVVSALRGLVTSQPLPSKIAVFRADGTLFPGWPVELNYEYVTTPLILDIDGDGEADLLGAAEGALYALNKHGKLFEPFPFSSTGVSIYAPLVADVDGDSQLEFLVGGGSHTSLYLYDLPVIADQDTIQWPMLLHDPGHTGRLEIK